MIWRTMVVPILALLAFSMTIDGAQAQYRDHDRDRGGDRGGDRDRGGPGRDAWDLLGEQSVGFSVDRDTIRVGRREGFFSKIAVEVRGNDVEVLDLKVFFDRGPPQDVRVRELIRAGSRTRPLDLSGSERVIDRIQITYRARQNVRGEAKVAIYGLKELPPQRDVWDELGRGLVGFGQDRDTIRVGRREGRFNKIAFEILNNDVQIQDVKVFFDRGPPQDLPVREFVRAGSRSRPLDLRGEDRVIDRIEFVYRSRPSPRGPARIVVYGLRDVGHRGPPPPPPPPSAGRWEELGCGKVGIKPDRDSIKVGRREGRFSAIKLGVRNSKIELIDLTVVYERGPPDEIQVRKKISEGDETPPLDLRGERRVIDRVDLTYRQVLGLNLIKGPATVCVYGR